MTTNTDGAMPELLPCPFCGDDGEKGRQTVTQMNEEKTTFCRILCRCCGAMAPEPNWQSRAAIQQAAGAVPGWKLVPICMTPDMRTALLNVHDLPTTELYTMLLAASPSPLGREAGSSDHLAACDGGGVTQPLTGDELALFRQTLEGFADCGETETDYDILVSWAQRGLLECTNFRPTAAAHRMLASNTPTDQKGNAA